MSIKDRLNLDEVSQGFRNIMDGIYKEKGIEFNFTLRTRRTPGYLTISKKIENDSLLMISKMGLLQRFAKKMNVLKVFNTYDKEFDDEYSVLTNDHNFAGSFLSNRGRLNKIKESFSLKKEYPLIRLELNKNTFNLVFLFGDKAFIDLDEKNLEDFIRLLEFLSDDLPVSSRPLISNESKVASYILLVIAFTGSIAGILMLIAGLMNYRLAGYALYFDSLKISIPLLFIFWFFSFHIIKGKFAP